MFEPAAMLCSWPNHCLIANTNRHGAFSKNA